jgi:acyl-CoA synthetase (AMP-forming)/AMP-acid ligase II
MAVFSDILNGLTKDSSLINDAGEKLSYIELVESASVLYNKIGHRCLVFCLCQNSIESLIGYFSFLSNRVVPLMLDASLEETLLHDLIKVYQPEYIWLPKNRYREFVTFEVVYDLNEYYLVCFGKTNTILTYENLALLLTTSGSTGSPKLVRLSYDNIKSNAESIAQYLSINETERPITSLPMHYSYGLSVINSHLISGATILLTDKSIAQKEFWTFAREQKATSIAGVPYTYEMLKRLRFFSMLLPDLKVMTQAGGKLSAGLVQEYVENAKEADKKFYVMYGQTEATARMSYLPFESATEKYSSIGIAIPGGTFKLIDDDGIEIIESGKDGELIYSGRNVCLGYAECIQDLQKGDENKGILFTGDIARRDSEGYYYITGRKKRFIKIWGNRVNLDAAEQIIKEITSSCACVGVDDKMLVYLTDETKSEQCLQLLASKTGLNSRAFGIRIIAEIPKNTSGKVLYSDLKNE